MSNNKNVRLCEKAYSFYRQSSTYNYNRVQNFYCYVRLPQYIKTGNKLIQYLHSYISDGEPFGLGVSKIWKMRNLTLLACHIPPSPYNEREKFFTYSFIFQKNRSITFVIPRITSCHLPSDNVLFLLTGLFRLSETASGYTRPSFLEQKASFLCNF